MLESMCKISKLLYRHRLGEMSAEPTEGVQIIPRNKYAAGASPLEKRGFCMAARGVLPHIPHTQPINNRTSYNHISAKKPVFMSLHKNGPQIRSLYALPHKYLLCYLVFSLRYKGNTRLFCSIPVCGQQIIARDFG